MKYDLDTGMGTRIGLVVLSTDETLETEARSVLAGRDVAAHHTRIFSDNEVTAENLISMQERMAASASLLPGELDAVGYGCTSASALMGPDLVEGQVQLAHLASPSPTRSAPWSPGCARSMPPASRWSRHTRRRSSRPCAAFLNRAASR